MSKVTPVSNAQGLVLVKLREPYGPYNRGEIGGFPAAIAQEIVESRSPFGEYYQPSKAELERKAARAKVRRGVRAHTHAARTGLTVEEAQVDLDKLDELKKVVSDATDKAGK